MRYSAFLLAILTYAIFSSPTPEAVGIAELIIASLLITALGFSSTLHALTTQPHNTPFDFHRLFILFMLSVPLCIGTINGHAPSDIMRDVVPIIFLAIPLVMAHRDMPHLVTIMMIAGTCLALRYLMIIVPNFITLGLTPYPDHMLYLANAPLVPFAAITGFALFTQKNRILWSQRAVGLIITLVCLLAMAAMMQRAPALLTLLGCLALTITNARHAPITRGTLTLVLIGLVSATFWPIIIGVAEGLWTKTLTVGLNSRREEFMAIAATAPLLGHGWGALWQSPAVGHEWVRFTHNMVTYYWWKAGIIGASLSALFIIVWLRENIKMMRHDFATGIAVFIPLAIHMTLYTGYKTLDFALLLLLMMICRKKNRS